MRTRSRTSGKDSRVTLVEPDGTDEDDFEELTPPPKKARKSSSSPPKPKTPKPFKIDLEPHEAHPAPKRWREAYDILVKQRATIIAPVDHMGCTEAGKLEDDVKRSDTDPRSKRLQTLVSLILSSQTKDPVTAEATGNVRSLAFRQKGNGVLSRFEKLRRNLPGGLTLESILSATEEDIQKCINKVGFWRRKTEYIMKTAAILRDEHDADVPKTIEGLLALPGVGPKMGFLALQEAWGLNVGIGVDTHVHRLTNRLRWHRKQTTDPEQTRLNLQSWLPKEIHPTINKTLVGFGQVICLPIGPRCDLCDLAKVKGLCPSKQAVSPRKKSSPAKIEKIEDEAVVKVEVEAALVDGQEIRGEMLVTPEGMTVEKREVEDEQVVLKHEDVTW